MLLTGVKFMVIGMTVVFCFLGLLVLVLRNVSAIAGHLPGPSRRQEPPRTHTAEDRERIAAAIAAVAAHAAAGRTR